LQKAKELPKTPTVDLVTAFCKDTATPGMRGRALDLKGMQRKIQRYKTKSLQYPKKPSKFADLEVLPEKFQTTFDGDRFLLFNKVVGAGQAAEVAESTQEGTQGSSANNGFRIIGYASNYGLNLLRQAEIWSADGTFSVAPPPFYQIYTIMAHLDGYAFPSAYVFMPGKKRYMYKVNFLLMKP
jgi:hypothetical protein